MYRFKGEGDGGFPVAGLAIDNAGNLYGTASLGGNFACDDSGLGCGVVFKITRNPDN